MSVIGCIERMFVVDSIPSFKQDFCVESMYCINLFPCWLNLIISDFMGARVNEN